MNILRSKRRMALGACAALVFGASLLQAGVALAQLEAASAALAKAMDALPNYPDPGVK